MPAQPPPRAALDRDALETFLASELDFAFRRRLRWLLAALDLRPSLRLLDLGCGPGVLLRALDASAPRVRAAGLDEGIDRLREARAAPTPFPLLRGDAQALPFRDASFERVLAAEVLEHLPDDAAALAEIRRVLAPGGLLALSVPNAGYPFLWDPINRAWSALGGAPLRTGPPSGFGRDTRGSTGRRSSRSSWRRQVSKSSAWRRRRTIRSRSLTSSSTASAGASSRAASFRIGSGAVSAGSRLRRARDGASTPSRRSGRSSPLSTAATTGKPSGGSRPS